MGNVANGTVSVLDLLVPGCPGEFFFSGPCQERQRMAPPRDIEFDVIMVNSLFSTRCSLDYHEETLA